MDAYSYYGHACVTTPLCTSTELCRPDDVHRHADTMIVPTNVLECHCVEL